MRQPLLAPVRLILVDEADRLKVPSLEQLRDLFDRSEIGLDPDRDAGIEKRLARYPQLYSRVGFVHAFRSLRAEEMRRLLAEHWPEMGRACSQQQAYPIRRPWRRSSGSLAATSACCIGCCRRSSEFSRSTPAGGDRRCRRGGARELGDRDGMTTGGAALVGCAGPRHGTFGVSAKRTMSGHP